MKIDEYTHTTQSENAFPPITVESLMESIKKLEPLRRRAEESRRKLEEMGLCYDTFTEELTVIDPFKLPDAVRNEWLRQLAERAPWNRPLWNLEDNET